MLLKSITPRNILSFADDQEEIPLQALNILIGHNGSGKSNLIECVSLLQAAPKELSKPIRDGGGVLDWLWKGKDNNPTARLEAVIQHTDLFPENLRYWMEFTSTGSRFELRDERIEDELPKAGHDSTGCYFTYKNGRPFILRRPTNSNPFIIIQAVTQELRREDLNPELSILSQRKDPESYPEITWLGEYFSRVYIYRDWSFGRYTPSRLPQKTDMPSAYLSESFDNLALALNTLTKNQKIKRELIRYLRILYPSVEDFSVDIQVNTVQIILHEKHFPIPATRLSDGTLRFLCLLAILLHPNPPALICLEEPELGLHPDVMPTLAELLRDASSRTQLIVTTHSDLLVEEFTETAGCVLTFEKKGDRSEVRRLNPEELEAWLERYTLGQLRQRGHIPGNRF